MKDTKSKRRVAKNGNLKSIVKLISYLIYPKKKDFQKSILLVLGFLTGKLFVEGQINVGYSLKQLFILFFVVDFLIYQARYQWNDIRGLTEDIGSGKEDRLFCMLSTEGQPNAGERKKAKRAVIVSLITMVLKIIVACFIILVVDKQMFFPLLSCSVLVFLIATLYEEARTKKRISLVFILVSFGYPLRFFAGLWTAYPEILNLEILTKFFSQFIFVLQQLWLNGINGINGIISLPSIVFLLFAYAFWGESSVILAWTHEAILQKNPQKIHYQYLYRQVENNDQKRPLSCTANGKIIKIWNWTHIVSMVFLSLSVVSININNRPWVLIVGAELLTLLFLIFYITKSREQVKDMMPLMAVIIVKAVFSFRLLDWSLFYIYICITQLLFNVAYHFLRHFFDPKFDCVRLFREVSVKFFMWLSL